MKLSLQKQSFSAIIWTVIDTFLLKGLTFIASVILARLLGPEEFGLIGMVSIFIAIGISLVDSGLSASLIRTEDANDSDYSTVFYLNILISLLVYIVIYFCAPYIAKFYGYTILTDIIRLYCFSFIISAFSAVQIAQLNKKMQFRKIMFINIPGTIIGVITGVTLGYFGYGVWSIVWMYISTQIIQSLLLWTFSRWKPTNKFSIIKVKQHFGFGYKLMLSGLLNTIFSNIYDIIIGKFYAVKSLGYFERARTLNEYPVTILTGVISKVSYPLLAQILGEKDRISEIYKQILQFSFFITVPLMLGAAAIANPLFELILGKIWLPSVPYFQIICLASIFYPVNAFNINILKLYGRSDLFLKLEVLKKIVVVISILFAFPYGIIGLIWSNVIVSFLALIINMYYSSDMINYKTSKQLLDMIPTILSGIIVFLIMLGLVFLLKSYSLYFQISIPIITGVILYISINLVLKTIPMLFVLKTIKKIKI
jgi:O-antigen/teichoic acid export membrane protein